MNNIRKIYLLSLISFLVGMSQFIIVGILDKVAASVGVSITTAGQLITAFALAAAIGTPIIMVATAKLDQRRQLLLALSILILGIVSTIALPGFAFLMASRAILGVGSGVFVVTAYAIAAQLAVPGRQGEAMSNIAMGFGASLVFGVPIGRIIATVYDWQVIFWGIGILSLLGFLAVMKTIPATVGEAPMSLGKQVALLKKPKIAVALGITFIVFTSYSMVNTYITPILACVIPVSEQKMSSILFALGIASLFGSKIGGLLADRVGITRTLIGSMIVQALALLLLTNSSGSMLESLPLLMLWVIGAWTFGPTQSFNLVSLAEGSGIMLSLNSSFVQFGFAAGAGLGGIAVGGASIMAATWAGAALVIVAASISVLSLRVTRSSL
ncbi:putative MFS-type transporter YbcL [Sporomusaceae bacterium FL31]|nr:putative MFS-type transporter YbcL [Sporomusaceae bacterium FL31]GCE33748.1 putative MFS-type transporter YbcL [Sporomusaceae bacterium]